MTNEGETPSLDELRRELEAMGMVVVPFRDEIQVRRSTLEYVRVRIKNGALHCESWVGVLSQVRTTWMLLALEAIVFPTLFIRAGVTPQALTGVFVGLLGFGFHSLRYLSGEMEISRIQNVWLDLRRRHRVAAPSAPPMLEGDSTRAIGEGAVREHVTVPRSRVAERDDVV